MDLNAKATSIVFEDTGKPIACKNVDILRELARYALKFHLYGSNPIEQVQVDSWITYSITFEIDQQENLDYLASHLTRSHFLVGNKLSIADFAVFDVVNNLDEKALPKLVFNWREMLKSQKSLSQVLSVVKIAPKIQSKEKQSKPTDGKKGEKTGERKQEGKFVDLPGAEMGKVIVRFPPEASGYLHIGHAKAALLNQYYQQAFNGKLIMRFDDTNPAKETIEFENVILGDLELLQIKPDLYTHTSQYFDLMLEYCETLMKEGKAYVDDTEAAQMKIEREQRIESPNRSNNVEKNFSLWKKMLAGSARGQQCCVRAKIDMSSPNGCMRDPTIYRCKNEPHPRTGTKYK